jgi:hypothetical protein
LKFFANRKVDSSKNGLNESVIGTFLGTRTHRTPENRAIIERSNEVRAMNYAADRSPIPLRPDPSAVFATALRSLARAAVVTARRARNPHAKSQWRDDADVDLIMRSAVAPSSTSNTAALMTVRMAFIAALQPVSAAAAVITKSMQLSFDNALSIGFPSLIMPRAQWIRESAPIPVVQGVAAAGPRLNPTKVAVIVSLSNEMINASNAESIIRQMLIENTGPVLDQAMFSSGAGVPGLQPPGILSGVAPIAASSGTGYDAMIDDVGNIAQALAPVSGSGQPIIVAAPKQAVALGMAARDPLSVLSSAALPVGTVIGVVPQALATVVEAPRLDASGEAGSLHMEDTAPAEIVDGSGVYAKPVMSVFQMDSVALRLILPATWQLRSPSAVAWIQGTNW